MLLFGWVVVLLMVTACQVMNAPDMPATLQTENEQVILEATAIAGTAQANHAAVNAAAAASMTEVAEMRASNQVLLATVRAGDPPPERVVASTDGRVPDLAPGQRWFMKTGVSQAINESDGCVVSPQISFTSDVPNIYATLRAFNIEPGIQFSALWERDGAEVFRDSFVLPRSASEICIWFSISQSDAPFLPGNWTVRLFANGAQLESPVAFTLRAGDGMDMMAEGG